MVQYKKLSGLIKNSLRKRKSMNAKSNIKHDLKFSMNSNMNGRESGNEKGGWNLTPWPV